MTKTILGGLGKMWEAKRKIVLKKVLVKFYWATIKLIRPTKNYVERNVLLLVFSNFPMFALGTANLQ
jgi:hypothetical protein